jgi:hypothetical protein
VVEAKAVRDEKSRMVVSEDSVKFPHVKIGGKY